MKEVTLSFSVIKTKITGVSATVVASITINIFLNIWHGSCFMCIQIAIETSYTSFNEKS